MRERYRVLRCKAPGEIHKKYKVRSKAGEGTQEDFEKPYMCTRVYRYSYTHLYVHASVLTLPEGVGAATKSRQIYTDQIENLV